jgi:ERF superfamily
MSVTHSPELNELATALSAAQAEFTAIPKDSDNPFFKSKYAGLPKVVEVASPILTKHGLAVSQFLGVDEAGDVLTTWLLHRSGQYIVEAMRLHSAPGKGQSPAQAQGSAATYARRYAYMSALGLVADEDDDGNSTGVRPQTKAPPVQTAPSVVFVSDQDKEELKTAAKGLKAAQVKLAMSASGVDIPEPFVPAIAFDRVPADKAVDLMKGLLEAKR